MRNGQGKEKTKIEMALQESLPRKEAALVKRVTKTMDMDKLSIFRELLEKRKEEILREIENQRKSFRREAGLGNMFDQTTDSSCRDEYFQARDNETEMLYQINEALERIESGNYGICESCGEEIPEGRLATKPFALLCVECRRKEEEK